MGARTGPARDRRAAAASSYSSLRAGLTAPRVGVPLLSRLPAARTARLRRAADPRRRTNPVRWPLSKKYPIDRVRPEARARQHAAHLQLRRLPLAADDEGLRGEVRASTSASRRSTTPTRRSPRSPPASLGFDLYFPSYDSLGKLIQADLLRPLNRDYLTNVTTCGSSFDDPWYDLRLRATRSPTPSTRTGIGWRTDMADVDLAQYDNPYDVFWDTQYPGNIAILDDWHTAIGDGAAAQRHRRHQHHERPQTSSWSA